MYHHQHRSASWSLTSLAQVSRSAWTCSNSCFKFVNLCIAPCNAVNSDRILKVRDFQFVFNLFTNTRTCWRHNELKNVLKALGFRLVHYSDFLFIVSPAQACLCKQTIHIRLSQEYCYWKRSPSFECTLRVFIWWNFSFKVKSFTCWADENLLFSLDRSEKHCRLASSRRWQSIIYPGRKENWVSLAAKEVAQMFKSPQSQAWTSHLVVGRQRILPTAPTPAQNYPKHAISPCDCSWKRSRSFDCTPRVSDDDRVVRLIL